MMHSRKFKLVVFSENKALDLCDDVEIQSTNFLLYSKFIIVYFKVPWITPPPGPFPPWIKNSGRFNALANQSIIAVSSSVEEGEAACVTDCNLLALVCKCNL